METITLSVDKSAVYEEVAKATDYTGSKMTEDEDARDRILSTDEDLKTFSRFWEEAAAVAQDRMKRIYISGSAPREDTYTMTLEVSKAFNKELVPSIEVSLRSYFILSILGKWYKFTNKREVSDCFTEAGEMIEDVMRKLYTRMAPRRRRK